MNYALAGIKTTTLIKLYISWIVFYIFMGVSFVLLIPITVLTFHINCRVMWTDSSQDVYIKTDIGKY